MGDIRLEVSDGVAVVTVDAPAQRNALTPAMATSLIEACETVDGDGSVGAAVVQGADGQFCAGADRATLSEIGTDPASDERYRMTGVVYGAFQRVGQLAVPTIAAVRGAAVGAGVNLALATDLRIVAANARIIAGFLRIGIHPGGGFFALAGRVAGREGAAALGLFSQEVSGARAAELGMAWEALPDEQVEPRARELAALAAADPELARQATRSFRAELGPPAQPWPVALEFERGTQMWSLRRRAEAEEGP